MLRYRGHATEPAPFQRNDLRGKRFVMQLSDVLALHGEVVVGLFGIETWTIRRARMKYLFAQLPGRLLMRRPSKDGTKRDAT